MATAIVTSEGYSDLPRNIRDQRHLRAGVQRGIEVEKDRNPIWRRMKRLRCGFQNIDEWDEQDKKLQENCVEQYVSQHKGLSHQTHPG